MRDDMDCAIPEAASWHDSSQEYLRDDWIGGRNKMVENLVVGEERI